MPTGDTGYPTCIQNGVAIRCLRIKDGWSVAALAAQVGIKQPTLTNIEREKRSVTPQLLNRIARALNVPTAAICRNPSLAETRQGLGIAAANTEAVA